MTDPTPPAPVEAPATSAGVAAWLQGAASAEELAPIVAAVNYRLAAPVGWLAPDIAADGTSTWGADVVLGANMLAGRLWRRRNSPAGVESFAGDVAVYVQRNDPDIGWLLRMGRNARPAVG